VQARLLRAASPDIHGGTTCLCLDRERGQDLRPVVAPDGYVVLTAYPNTRRALQSGETGLRFSSQRR
jgi:hypothetical protein